MVSRGLLIRCQEGRCNGADWYNPFLFAGSPLWFCLYNVYSHTESAIGVGPAMPAYSSETEGYDRCDWRLPMILLSSIELSNLAASGFSRSTRAINTQVLLLNWRWSMHGCSEVMGEAHHDGTFVAEKHRRALTNKNYAWQTNRYSVSWVWFKGHRTGAGIWMFGAVTYWWL